ncbi:PEP-CTERM sorting domain-containing protein [Singulisphaera sp. PoT]|uniref:PEP-CTERM sorting domain-containing protein n=1 Tax=Singulisphaera sp. PoT TaxID=3411797 RepID=UPI003BF51E41
MRRIGFSTLVLALTVFGGLGMNAAEASPITYSTSAWIDGNFGPGASPISLGTSSGTLYTPGSINLGTFNTSLSLPESASLTYANTPFTIDVYFNTSSGTSILQVNGLLNGTITGTTSSTLQASVASVTNIGGNPLPFPLDTFQVLAPQTISPGGASPLYAYVSYNVPEPTTLALCGSVLAGLAVRRMRRRMVVA